VIKLIVNHGYDPFDFLMFYLVGWKGSNLPAISSGSN